jgi:hypothetical protein
LKYKQGGVLYKNRTMNNVDKYNICVYSHLFCSITELTGTAVTRLIRIQKIIGSNVDWGTRYSDRGNYRDKYLD